MGWDGSGSRAPEALLVAPAAILEGLPDAVVAAASDGRIVFANVLAEQLFGWPHGMLVGQPVETLWPERMRERYVRNMQLYFATNHPLRFSIEAWGLRRDGSEFVGEMSWGIVESSAGRLLLAIGRDITERRTADERLRAVSALGERALAGEDPAALGGEAVRLLVGSLPLAGARIRLAGGKVLAAIGSSEHAGVRLAIGEGDKLLLVAQNKLSDAEMGLARNVANILTNALARLRREERMRHTALRDPLTGLANRTLLQERLEHARARSQREGGTSGVLFIDIDEFKAINDAHGHAAGDAVLIELSKRLSAAVRPGDTVARIGGDEFVVCCEQIDESSIVALADRLQRAIRTPLTVAEKPHAISASIGIALGSTPGAALLDEADAALYKAKAGGGDRARLFGHRAREDQS